MSIIKTSLHLKLCQRHSSALPKTIFIRKESNESKSPQNILFIDSTKVHSHILKKQLFLQKEWKKIGTDGLIKDYLQVNF